MKDMSDDLIVLRFNPDRSNMDISPAIRDKSFIINDLTDVLENSLEPDFGIDVDRNTWEYEIWQEVPIGEHRDLKNVHSQEVYEGVIGVYDRKNNTHLERMIGIMIRITMDGYAVV